MRKAIVLHHFINIKVHCCHTHLPTRKRMHVVEAPQHDVFDILLCIYKHVDQPAMQQYGLYLGGAAPGGASLGEVDPVLPAIDAETVISHTELRTVVFIAPMPCIMQHL